MKAMLQMKKLDIAGLENRTGRNKATPSRGAESAPRFSAFLHWRSKSRDQLIDPLEALSHTQLHS